MIAAVTHPAPPRRFRLNRDPRVLPPAYICCGNDGLFLKVDKGCGAWRQTPCTPVDWADTRMTMSSEISSKCARKGRIIRRNGEDVPVMSNSKLGTQQRDSVAQFCLDIGRVSNSRPMYVVTRRIEAIAGSFGRMKPTIPGHETLVSVLQALWSTENPFIRDHRTESQFPSAAIARNRAHKGLTIRSL
ncbi:uncharacterized protein B0I36DRAFT_127080 [Microdochium trichocladiopsis]|uniref:Uncharacterized protein n=1 Tax=Microdochium trichocladiopsis TaxID=1682393 RepID=A0A9P9BPC9_9PEZI|nr:uncharacterized protein B0I36DRAFT_127080 [Microdochium trichocladiopsis]KAH7028945.1 hypothetical protein B0I36DRAFT_127080 [Microdochium trichocladiopsis]